jgi:hypothetical protein
MPDEVRRGFTLDAGALIAYERRTGRIRGLLKVAAIEGRTMTVPAVVLAQVWRQGTRGNLLEELLGLVTVEPFTRREAKLTGELLARSGTADIVDAAVAMSAALRGDIVLTSDPDDLHALAEHVSSIRVLTV